MKHYDDHLHQLHREAARYQQLSSQLPQLHRQRAELQAQRDQLAQALEKEEKDVDRLEHGSLAAFFYELIGKKEEKLDTERQEAYAARIKLNAAISALAEVEATIATYQAQQDQLQDRPARYQAALQEKSQAIKASGTPQGEQILRYEARITHTQHQDREIREAIEAGEAALIQCKTVLLHLNTAEDYGTWDIFGGGLVADLGKYSAMEDAQQAIEALHTQLLRFRTELTDVAPEANISLDIPAFYRFADVFWDNFFTDLAALDRIQSAAEQARNTRAQLDAMLRSLRIRLTELEQIRESLKEERDQLILEV